MFEIYATVSYTGLSWEIQDFIMDEKGSVYNLKSKKKKMILFILSVISGH